MRYSPTANLYGCAHWMPRGRRDQGPLVPTSEGPDSQITGTTVLIRACVVPAHERKAAPRRRRQPAPPGWCLLGLVSGSVGIRR